MNDPEVWPAMRLGNGRQVIEGVPPRRVPAPG
jgi:hypothetical protein